MTETRIPRSIGVALLAFLTVLVSLVAVAPEADAAGNNPYSEFAFTFANGQTLTGSTAGYTGFEAPVPGTDWTIHVSCSQVFDDGWSSKPPAFPTESVHGSQWEILSYKIDRFKGDGSYHFTCGETFTPGSITVKKDATPPTEEFLFDLNGDIPAPPGGEPYVHGGSLHYVLGDNTASFTWGNLPAGLYTLTELMSQEQRDAGWDFTGVTCDSGVWTPGDELVTIDLRGGDNVTCTFSDVLEVEPLDVVVTVIEGQCEWNGEASMTSVEITINPESTATVTLSGPGGDQDFTESTTIEVVPGTYTWAAVGDVGYEVVVPSSGGFVAGNCPPAPTPVTVTVVPGACVWNGESSDTPVTITINPAGGAEVTIEGEGFSEPYTASTEVILGPGTYDWTAAEIEGYDLVSQPTFGTIFADDCEEPSPTVAVTLISGTCSWNGESSETSVTVTINPDEAATITLTGPNAFEHIFTNNAESIDVGPGQYNWLAEGVGEYVVVGTSSSGFLADECPPPGSIGDTVWHDIDGDGLQGEGEEGIPGVDVTLLSGDDVIANTSTDGEGNYLFDGLPPGDYDVVFDVPEGWVVTTPNAGDDALDSDAAVDGTTPTVTLGPDEDNLDTDMGLLQPATIIVRKITAPLSEGSFSFTGDITADLTHGTDASAEVLPGTYTVTEAIAAGWALTDITCTAGGGGDVTARTATYVVTSGDEVTCTFTNTNVGTLVIDKVTDVATDDDFTFTVGDQVVAIGSGESIQFSLVTGNYTITEDLVLADGWSLANVVCSAGATVSPATGSATLFVPPGATVGCTFVNAQAEEPLGIVGDLVWNDLNGDGIQGATEPGVGGVTVELLDATSAVVLTTTTNDAGIYVFANVPAGDYQVRFTAPSPWLYTAADQGSDDTVDSDAGASGLSPVFTLAAGQANTTIDAGVFQTVVLPQPPITPDTPGTPDTPVTPDTPGTPGATVPDTKVLAAQTELPDTGLDNTSLAIIASALLVGGWLMLTSVARKEDEDLILVGWSARIGA
ncbi:MAG: carboxypeptidase regulatory-like domain-containing protein [Acidimicrobiia bacterium]|nr:carboxypeptidase regulatory-like domain-containing protein [Acidimicrobiia bacterium]